MECPGCGADVVAGQRFCNACGTSLAGVTDVTAAVDVTEADEPIADVVLGGGASVAFDELERTEAVEIREALPDPHWATRTGEIEAVEAVEEAPAVDPDEVSEEDIWATTQIPTPTVEQIEAARTTDELAALVQAAPTGSTTEELPAVGYGEGMVVGSSVFAPDRQPTTLRLVFVLAVFAGIATLLAAVADVVDLRTSRPVDGIATGFRSLDDFGSNLAVAAFVGAGVMFVGGLLACFGLRWGAGLAGGAGLATAGWAALTIGLAEVPIAVAQSVTRASTEQFTLTVTRDVGWWLIVGVGALGLLVFLASLRQAGSGGRASLNPWVAAVGAVGMLIVAVGPMIPVNGASLADNFRSTNANIDLPTAYFVGRMVQVGLIALVGIVGFLLVRRWGLGLAIGGLSIPLWLWVTSLAEVDDRTLGIAAINIGATDTVPHGVTTVGIALTVVVIAVASSVAVALRNRV